MTVYDMLQRQYLEAKKNNFFDAWGIVINPATLAELKAEIPRCNACSNTVFLDDIEKIFGLVIIPHNRVEKDKAYVVDEFLGKAIIHGILMGK